MSGPEAPVKITELRPHRGGRRIAVFADEEFVLSCREEDLHRLGWRAGHQVTIAELQKARRELEFPAVAAAAERLLGYRAQAERELLQRLRDRGYSPIAIEYVLPRLREQGYINDQALAARYAETAPARKLGSRRVASDLRRRGVNAGIAEAAASTVDRDAERAAALEFISRRSSAARGLDPRTRRRRLVAALERRGFSSGVIRSVIEEVFTDDNSAFGQDS